MVDTIEEVFDIGLSKIKKSVVDANYPACSSVTSDLTTISIWFEYKLGTFISEVLDDVFGRVDFALSKRVVDEDSQNEIREQLGHQLDDVLKSFNADNKNNLFDALINIHTTSINFLHSSYDLPQNEPKTSGDAL